MRFVAPEQAPEQAEVIKNTPFWPDVDLSEFRSVMRTDGTVTSPRLKQLILSAMSEVNAELFTFVVNNLDVGILLSPLLCLCKSDHHQILQ